MKAIKPQIIQGIRMYDLEEIQQAEADGLPAHLGHVEAGSSYEVIEGHLFIHPPQENGPGIQIHIGESGSDDV